MLYSLKGLLIIFTIVCMIIASMMATAFVRRSQHNAFSVVIDQSPPIIVKGKFAQVEDVLDAAGITWRPVDLIIPDITASPDQNQTIVINRAHEIDVVLPAGRTRYFTHQPTLGSFLAEADVTIHANTTILADGLPIPFEQINALQLPHVVMITPQQQKEMVVSAPMISPTATTIVILPTPMPPAAISTIEKASYPVVSKPIQVEDVSLPFETVWQDSDLFEIDTTGVIITGQVGILRRELDVNGTIEREFVLQEPIDQINGYGTRPVIRTLITEDGERYEYWRKVNMRLTSYTAAMSGKDRSDPWYGVTASGVRAGYGVIAVDRSIVPWRSWVYIPGYGRGYAGDVSGRISGRAIDLGYDDNTLQSWDEYEEVYFLTPVPEPERINYLLP